MFAYCGNNPVTRYDTGGDSWTTLGIGVTVAGITGLSNGYSSYISGGEFWPAFWIGFGSGGVGYALSFTTQNPLALVSFRSLTSLGSDLLTTAANSNTVTPEDWVVSGWDAVMDGVFSTFTYYYNPFSNDFSANAFNAIVDGLTDIVETWLYNSPTDESMQNAPINPTQTIRRPGRKRPRNYVALG